MRTESESATSLAVSPGVLEPSVPLAEVHEFSRCSPANNYSSVGVGGGRCDWPHVSIHVEVRGISSVNIETHTFEAILAVHMRWRASSPAPSSTHSSRCMSPRLISEPAKVEVEQAGEQVSERAEAGAANSSDNGGGGESAEFWSKWKPELRCTNAVEFTVMDDRHQSDLDSDLDSGSYSQHGASGFRRFEHWRDMLVKGTFATVYNAQYFPFDTQELCFTWRCVASRRHHEPFPVARFAASVHRNVRLTEWHVPHDMNIISDESGVRYGVTCHVRRRYTYYLWKVPVLLFCVGSIALTNYLQDVDAFKDRTDHNVGVYTFVVMLQFTIPNLQVPYLTVLDCYFFAIMLFLFAIEVCNALVIQDLGFDDGNDHLNDWMLVVASSLWFGWHLLLFTYFSLWRRVGLWSPYQIVTHSSASYECSVTKLLLHEQQGATSSATGSTSATSSASASNSAPQSPLE